MLEIGDYDVRNFLGRGMNCQAYYVVKKSFVGVAKLFPPSKFDARKTEKAMLELFATHGIKNVPKLVEECSNTENFALIVTPLGNVVRPVAGGAIVRGKQLAPLVTLLEQIHTRLKIAHRDIKPGM
jgi:hypothetical protein